MISKEFTDVANGLLEKFLAKPEIRQKWETEQQKAEHDARVSSQYRQTLSNLEELRLKTTGLLEQLPVYEGANFASSILVEAEKTGNLDRAASQFVGAFLLNHFATELRHQIEKNLADKESALKKFVKDNQPTLKELGLLA